MEDYFRSHRDSCSWVATALQVSEEVIFLSFHRGNGTDAVYDWNIMMLYHAQPERRPQRRLHSNK